MPNGVVCFLACQDALARVDVRCLVPFGAVQDAMASACWLGRMPVVRTCHLTGPRVISRRRLQASRSIYRRWLLVTPLRAHCTAPCVLAAMCCACWWGTGFQGLLHLEQARVHCLALAMQCLCAKWCRVLLACYDALARVDVRSYVPCWRAMMWWHMCHSVLCKMRRPAYAG